MVRDYAPVGENPKCGCCRKSTLRVQDSTSQSLLAVTQGFFRLVAPGDGVPDVELPLAGTLRKVRQILINLLSNAIKFTGSGGHIELRCVADASTMCVSVKDDDDGIPEDKHEAVFEPFVQVGRDFSSSPGGTGLGLSISRDLARRMEGDLEVKSEIGKSSTFTLTLPIAKPPARSTTKAPRQS